MTATIPEGQKVCPTCQGVGVVGRRGRNGDPQDEDSTDCPGCDPHDGTASLGYVPTGASRYPSPVRWPNR